MNTDTRQFAFIRCRRGTSAVEFALIVPVLLVLVFNILCFGIYFGTLHGVQQLAAEAARASIGGLNDSERVMLAQANVTASAATYPFLTPARLTIGSAVADAATNSFTVTLRYDASASPIFAMPYVPLPPSTIVRSATIQKGGY